MICVPSEDSVQPGDLPSLIRVIPIILEVRVFTEGLDGWMDDLQFYVLFSSVSVISGRWEVDNERLCPMELHLGLRSFGLERRSNSVR